MTDLRVFLRYGIVGYLLLFYDVILICSYVGLSEFFVRTKDTQLGLIIGIMGLPIGWLCYQIWDSYINNFQIKKSPNIKRIQKIEKDFLEVYSGGKSEIMHPLDRKTIKVISNITLAYCANNNVQSYGHLTTDPRKKHHAIYSNSQQSRGVVGAILFLMTIIIYSVTIAYLHFKGISIYPPKDMFLWLTALILPCSICIVVLLDYDRVNKEQQKFAWAILLDKKFEIRRLIEEFHKIKMSGSNNK